MDLMKVLDQTVRELKREVSKKVLKVPEIEIKVCEATSNEPWGPHGTIMGDIAQATRNYQEYHIIMGVLWKRLHDSGKNWRHVYKSLTVMEYLIANGAERAIDELQEQAYQIQALLDFQYIEPNGKDQGINVRKKAQSLMALINDRGKIREIRQKAAVNRDRYQGVSNTGMTFRQSSYLSTSGNYSDKDDERYGGGTSVNNIQREEERPGQDREEYRSQRETFNRDDEAEHERNEGGYANSSRGGDRSSDKSSTEGDIDEGLQYSRCSGNRGVAAAITRARTSQISQSSTGTPSVSQIPPRRELFFTINSPVDDDLDDFNPRGTSSKSTSVPVSKDEVCIQSQNAALEDLFADVEFQASFPPASFPATFSQNVPEQDYLQTSYSFSQATSRTNPIQPPTLNNTLTKEKFQPLTQAFPQASADHFNPSFASFESPKSTYTREVLDGRFHPMGDYSNNYSIKGFGSSTLGSPTKTTDNNDNLFGSLNPFCSDKPDDVMAGNQASQTNPFLSTTSSSAFWDDPLITNFVDFTIGRGQKHDQTTPLSMNEIGISMAASGAASVTRADSLPMGATALSMGMAHMSNNMGPGRSMSDLPKTN